MHGKIIAKNGILATHTPIGINPIQLYTAAYRSYVLAVELEDKVYPEINAWNLEVPHYAISTQSKKQDKPDLLVIAGSHHKTGQEKDTNRHFDELQRYLEKHFKLSSIAYRWSAQHYLAADGVPFIGLAKGYKNIYEATGFFADGLVYGTIAGIILSDSILKQKNILNRFYNTRRHSFIASLPFLIKENFNVFVQYLKDMPILSSTPYKDIQKDEAKVLEVRGEKLGAYRDTHDKLHVVSVVCTHMKCILNWNIAEKTWDCPCHGSRFSYEGEVIEGPAIQNLAKKREEEI
jgi:nitrite reductase/ring-hydroxylating ferredoxin subunit